MRGSSTFHSSERISVRVQTVYHESHCTHSWSHQFWCGTGALARYLGNFVFFKRNFIVVLRSHFAFLRSQIREENTRSSKCIKNDGTFSFATNDLQTLLVMFKQQFFCKSIKLMSSSKVRVIPESLSGTQPTAGYCSAEKGEVQWLN